MDAFFCSGDGRQAGLLYLAAGYRDTTETGHQLHSKLCVLILLSIYHVLSVQCLYSLHGHTLQYHLSTCRICNVSWFPTNRALQKRCVKKKHKLYTCITMFTESTEFPIRECCTCGSLRWRTRRVGSARRPQRLTLGQA